MLDATNNPRGSRINWINVSTVLSAAILIAAEVFGAAFGNLNFCSCLSCDRALRTLS